MDHLGFRRFGLVAQSGGTPYALAVAAAAGDRVTGLAFIAGMAPLDEPHAPQDVVHPIRIVGLLALARRAEWLLRLLLHGLSRRTAKDQEAVARTYANRMLPGRSSRARRSNPLGDSRPQLSRNRGELDRNHPPSMSRRLATRLGEAPVTVVTGAATFAMLPSYSEALRHAAALPEEAPPVGGQAFRPESSTSNEAVGPPADATRR